MREPARDFDYLAPPAAREAARGELETRWRGLPKAGAPVPTGWLLGEDATVDRTALDALRARQASRVIRIGE